MQSKIFIKKSFIIVSAILLCSALCGSVYLRKAFDPKPVEGLDYDNPPTWSELAADPELREEWLVDPDSINDLYLGQTEGGVCTHDETFTEPVIPDGRYYLGGDANADYYVEITGNTFCLRNSDGTVASDDKTWGGEREYKVITDHMGDAHFFCSEWEDYTPPEGSNILDKYRMIHGIGVSFDEDGKAYITPFAFRAGEGNVIRPDTEMRYSIP